MKRLSCLLGTIIFSITLGFSQTRCGNCGGNGKFYCNNCHGNGIVYTTIYDPYWGTYRQNAIQCSACSGYGILICRVCGGNGYTTSFKSEIRVERGIYCPYSGKKNYFTWKYWPGKTLTQNEICQTCKKTYRFHVK